jgi:hypothetical protein
MNQITTEKNSHALRYLPDLPTKTCPKCTSVFVTSHECESCGFQFSMKFIGEPLDRKSFYTFQEKYIVDVKKAFFTSTRKKITEEYTRAVWHRFDVLLKFFPDPENEHFSFFSIELKDIVEALLQLKISPDKIKFKCSQSEMPALKKYITEVMIEWNASYEKSRYPGAWEFFSLHSSNLKLWFVFYATVFSLGYIVLFLRA